MPNTIQQAYDAIKALEEQGKLPLPVQTAVVIVGTFYADTGKFVFSVPTTVETTVIDPGDRRARPPRPPIKVQTTLGHVQSGAVELSLTFYVKNPQGPLTVQAGGITATADPGLDHVTVPLGIASSPPPPGAPPPSMRAFIWSGNASTFIELQVLRQPAVSAGAFTLPAVPTALIYAPPPGAENKNFAEYTVMSAISTKISTTVGSGPSTKTATAYTATDFLDKISTVVSKLPKVGSALSTGLNLLSGILSAVATSTTSSASSALTTTTEHDLQITDTVTLGLGTPAGLGPGLGDRFGYIRNVRVVWLVADSELSITVLGDDGIRAFSAQDLLSDFSALASSSTPNATGPVTNLDAPSIQMLLKLDPFVGNPAPTLPGPRFVANDPAIVGGRGTDPNGDLLSVTHDVTTTDTATQTYVTVNIKDYKPGWLVALLNDNSSREDQFTYTYTNTDQTSVDQKQTASLHLFAAPTDPPYLVGVFFDRLFGTFAFTSAQEQLKLKQSGAAG